MLFMAGGSGESDWASGYSSVGGGSCVVKDVVFIVRAVLEVAVVILKVAGLALVVVLLVAVAVSVTFQCQETKV